MFPKKWKIDDEESEIEDECCTEGGMTALLRKREPAICVPAHVHASAQKNSYINALHYTSMQLRFIPQTKEREREKERERARCSPGTMRADLRSSRRWNRRRTRS